MNRRGKLLSLLLLVVSVLTLAATFYKTLVLEDFEIFFTESTETEIE